jgi:hypothetical protein
VIAADLERAEHLARRLGSANCWTGCSGTLASFALDLIREQRGETVSHSTPAQQLLDQAGRIIAERRSTYGPPAEHFAKTVAAVNAIFGHKLRQPLTVADWAQIMILDKLARHQGAARSADTPVDLAGYAACLAEVESE